MFFLFFFSILTSERALLILSIGSLLVFCSLPTFLLPFHIKDMADATELGDWELLQSNAPDSSAIKSDYFSLPPNNPIPSSSEEEATDEGGIDSDNPSSHGEFGSDSIHDTVFQEIECADPNSGPKPRVVEEQGEVMNKDGSEEIEENNGNLEKRRGGVWDLPWEIVKYYLTKVKPSWYISLAGAILGLVWIGRRMHRIRDKKRSESVRASMDGKRVTKFAVRAVYINEALKHVPILRTSPLAGGTTPGSLLALR